MIPKDFSISQLLLQKKKKLQLAPMLTYLWIITTSSKKVW